MFFLVLLSWLVAGLVVGFVANKVVNLRGDDPRFGIGAAVGGALLAGVLFAMIGGSGTAVWSWRGLTLAALGATAGAVAWHAVRSRSISHAGYTRRSSY